MAVIRQSCLAFFLALLLSSAALSQGIGLPNQSGDQPVEITADNGIEWQQNRQAYIARGNAAAKQGETTVYADTLTAWYRKDEKGGQSQIWRIDADGNVRIVSPRQTAYGTKGVYLIDKGLLVLTGKPKLVTETDTITARDSLEFWELKSLAVARGNAIAVRADRRLRADILTAHIKKDEKTGQSKIYRVEAFDNVLVSTADEIIRAKRGVYNVATGIVRVRDDVKITRGKDQLNGDAGEVNLNTGVSRLVSAGPKQVFGTFAPKRDRDDKKKSSEPGAGSAPAPKTN